GGGMVVGHVEAGRVDRWTGPLRQHPQRRLVGEGGLADSLGPGEQPGMVETAGVEPLAKGRDRFPGAEQRGHSRSSSASISRAVTSPGLPEASMARKRAGSAAARMAKACATRL